MDGLSQRAAVDLLDTPPVGDHFDLAPHRVGDAFAAGVDLQRVPPYLGDAEPIMDRADLAGGQLDLPHGFVQAFKPGRVRQAEFDGLGPVQVVVDHGRHGHFVAPCQRHRQIQIDKEGLEDPDRRLAAAQATVRGYGSGRQSPGGNRIRQVQLQLSPAGIVGD